MVKKSSLTIWQKIGLFFLDKKPVTVVLWLLVVVFGVLSYTSWMRRDGFPSVDVPIALVQVIAFEDSASTVDQKYTLPIIDAAKNEPTIKTVKSSSNDQGASIQLQFNDGTDVALQLKNLESQLVGKLPSTGRVIFVKINASKLTAEGEDLLISVYGANKTTEQLDADGSALALILDGKLNNASSVRAIPNVETINAGQSENGSDVAPNKAVVRFDRYYDHETGVAQNSSLVAVKGVENVDQLKLYDEVLNTLGSDEVKNANITASISANFAENIEEQISGLQRNLIEGLIVVIIVSFLLISLRGSIVTAIAMSSTVMITVGVLQLIGYSLNTITLFSLVLCLALIVDDTTIVVEAIDDGLKRSNKFRDVVSESIGKVTRASATGTLATILAFSPMLFIGGILGEFIRAIPITIIVSLLVSLIVSFVFIPLMMWFVRDRAGVKKTKAKKEGMKFFNPVAKFEEALGSWLANTVRWSAKSLKRTVLMRTGAVLLSLAFLVSGVLIFTRVEFNIFPAPKDGNDLIISGQVIDQELASIENTAKYTDTALAVIQTELGDNLEKVTLSVGRSGSGADRNGFLASVKLKDFGSRDETSVELAKKLQPKLTAAVPEMLLASEAAGVGPPASSFDVVINAEDPEKAYLLAQSVEEYLKTVVLTRPDNTTAGLKDITLTPNNILTRDGDKRIINISAVFDAKDTSALTNLAKDSISKEFNAQKLESFGLVDGDLSFSLGQEQENQDSFNSMGAAMPFLLLAVLVAMGILFRSIIQPILIISALPFAFFGVTAGLYLTDNPISFFSMLGIFALIGISLNNTILLTDYANQAQAKGEKPVQAMASAITKRLRPLLTTSITSILALLPLALNDPFWQGLAYALIFGLISSTILVLLVFPYFYLIAESIRLKLRGLFKVVKLKISR